MPGREHRRDAPFADSIPAAAEEVIAAVRRWTPLPWVAFGHSLGGSLAYECVRRLQSEDRAAAGLALAGARPPFRHAPPGAAEQTDAEVLESVRNYAGTPQAILDQPEALNYYLPRIKADFRLSRRYVMAEPDRLTVPILCLQAVDDTVVTWDAAAGWAAYAAGPFEMAPCGGGHFFPQGDVEGTADRVFAFVRGVTVPQILAEQRAQSCA
jgi:surfactin synthase thioesterase subunit